MGSGSRVDKEADANAERLEASDDFGKPVALRAGQPAGLAGHLSWHNRNERALIGAHFLDQIQQFGPWITFDVELDRRRQCAQHPGNFANVIGSDVASVGPRMHSDTRRAGGDRRADCVDDARYPTTARVAQGRDFVHVDGETNHKPLMIVD